jgi:hypothetical protein
MAREIPEVVRAAAGLAATVLDEARKLPETLPGLPVRLIGLAMQHAMKVQQQYAGFVARGDELFTGLRGEDEPGLATFDNDEPLPAPTGFRESAFDRAGDTEPTSANIDLILEEEVAAAQEAPDTDAILDEIAIDELVDQAPTLEETAPATPSAAETRLKAAGKAAKAPAKAARSAAKSATKAATKTATKAADAAEVVVQLAEPVKAAKPRKSAKAKRPAEDAASPETALLEAALAAPGTSDDASPAAVDSSTPDSSAPESPAGASTTETPTTPAAPTPAPTAPAPTAADTIAAAPTAEGATDVDATTTADVLPPAGDVAAQEKAAPADDSASGSATATDEGGTAVATASTDVGGGSDTAASSAPRNAPVDGYDSFTVAQLRGRLRGYALTSVEELIAYEQATRARAPYLTMLRNRLEKLEEQAVESSPLAPRGA